MTDIVHHDPPPVRLRDGYRFDRYARKEYLDYLRAGYGRRAAAERVGISQAQVRKTIQLNAEFAEAVRDAEGSADDVVQNSLYQKAVGHEAVDREGNVYHVPGNVEAQKFWLANRRTSEWQVGVARGNTYQIGDVGDVDDDVVHQTLDALRVTGHAVISQLLDKARRLEEVEADQQLDDDVIDAESEEVTTSIPPVPDTVNDPWQGE
jgi:hypothetical protein